MEAGGLSASRAQRHRAGQRRVPSRGGALPVGSSAGPELHQARRQLVPRLEGAGLAFLEQNPGGPYQARPIQPGAELHEWSDFTRSSIYHLPE